MSSWLPSSGENMIQFHTSSPTDARKGFVMPVSSRCIPHKHVSVCVGCKSEGVSEKTYNLNWVTWTQKSLQRTILKQFSSLTQAICLTDSWYQVGRHHHLCCVMTTVWLTICDALCCDTLKHI